MARGSGQKAGAPATPGKKIGAKPGPKPGQKRKSTGTASDTAQAPDKKKPPQKEKADTEVEEMVADLTNAVYLAKVLEKHSFILENELFQEAAGKPALFPGPDDAEAGLCGFLPPVQSTHIVEALKNSTNMTISGGGNLWWLNPQFLANPGVPISMTKVQALKSYHHKAPSAPCMELVVGVSDVAEVDDLERQQIAGRLKLLSPIEVLHAWIFAVAERIEAGADQCLLLFCFYMHFF